MVRQGTDVFRAHLTMAIAPETDGETRCRVTISDVTALREAQAGVRKSELWHEEFAAHLPLIMWTGLADGSCDFTTQQAAHYTGLSAEELLGWGFLETVHPDDRGTIQGTFAAAAPARGGSFSMDARVRRHDGEYRWFAVTANAARNDEGVAIRWFGVLIDIHERVVAEQALRESEELFRNTFYKHSAVKFLIDHDTGTIIDANEAAANFYGWSREQLLQMRIQDLNVLPPDQVQQEMAEARGRSKLEFEFRHRRADGSVRDVKVYSSSVTTASKAVLHSIVHDVTEQREAEEALSQSEAWLRQLSESLPALVCTALPGGLIEYATQSTAEYTGLTREALLGVGYLEAIHPEDRDGLRAAFAASAETGSPLYAEIRLRRHDGEYRWFAARGNPVVDATGKVIRWFGVNVDIHDVRTTQAALRQHSQLLDTIRKTHDVYIGHSATDDALTQLLDGVLALTGSGMGFLAEVREPQPGAESQEPCLVWQAMGGPELTRNPDLAALAQRTAGAEFRTLENHLGTCLRTEQVMIANDPSRDGHPLDLPPEHPPLRSFMGVPIRHAGAMVGMLGLANRDGGYDEDLVRFLEPLLVSCAAIFHDMRIEALEQKFLSQLLESESHYRTLFQTMAQGVIEYDRDGLV
ncbi:MAG: PAS domain S-box protein, partial [Armatimonadota bacterium]